MERQNEEANDRGNTVCVDGGEKILLMISSPPLLLHAKTQSDPLPWPVHRCVYNHRNATLNNSHKHTRWVVGQRQASMHCYSTAISKSSVKLEYTHTHRREGWMLQGRRGRGSGWDLNNLSLPLARPFAHSLSPSLLSSLTLCPSLAPSLSIFSALSPPLQSIEEHQIWLMSRSDVMKSTTVKKKHSRQGSKVEGPLSLCLSHSLTACSVAGAILTEALWKDALFYTNTKYSKYVSS